MKTSSADIERRFKSHSLDQDQSNRITDLRSAFTRLANDVLVLVPEGREQSIVLTKIEEASFFAVAGIARPKA